MFIQQVKRILYNNIIFECNDIFPQFQIVLLYVLMYCDCISIV